MHFLANFARKCVVFCKNLHGWQKFYMTAGRDGRDKSQLCEGWVHITRSQFTVHKSWTYYNFRISIKHWLQLRNLAWISTKKSWPTKVLPHWPQGLCQVDSGQDVPTRWLFQSSARGMSRNFCTERKVFWRLLWLFIKNVNILTFKLAIIEELS